MNERHGTGADLNKFAAQNRSRGAARHIVVIALVLLVAAMIPVGIHYLGTLMVTDGSTGNQDTTAGAAGSSSAGAGSGNASAPAVAGGAPATPNAGGATSPEVHLQTTATTLDLLIIDGSTKEPISGAQVQTRGGSRRFRGISDVDGHVKVPVPPKGFGYFSISTKAKGYIAKSLQWQPNYQPQAGDIPADYTLTLEKPTRISGKVLDDKGQPVAGAHVYFSFNSRGGDRHETTSAGGFDERSSVRTGEDGSWEFNGAPAHCDVIGICAWDYKHITNSYFNPEPFPSPAKLYDGTAILTLPSSVTVEGTVVDAAGVPIEGASVGLGGFRNSSNSIPPLQTDAFGKYSYGLAAGTSQTLVVTAKGHAPEMKQIMVGQGNSQVNFTLGAPQHVIGKVVDAAGQPVARANVNIQMWRNTQALAGTYFQTDATGHFRWDEAPADPVQCTVYARGQRQVEKTLTPGDTENVITLGSAVRMTGSVTDAETGQPVEKFKVVLGIVFQPNASQINWQPRWQTIPVLPGGRFEFNNEWEYPGIAVRIVAPGYLPGDSRVYKPSEGNQNIEIKLKPGKDLIATLQTPDGKPVVGANASLVIPGQSLFIMNGQVQNQTDSVESDANGHIDFPAQSGTFKIIAIAKDGYAEADDASLAKSNTLTLIPWGRIEGHAIARGKPAAGQKIVIYEMNRTYTPSAPMIQWQYEATVDDTGKFVAEQIPAGTMSVSRQISLGQQSFSSGPPESVIVSPGKTSTVTLGGKGRLVQGSVELPPELKARTDWTYNFNTIMRTRRASSGLLRLIGGGPPSEMHFYQFPVAPDGRFEVEDVLAGTYDLTISATEQGGTDSNPYGPGHIIGSVITQVVVPEMPSGHEDQPLEIPPLKMIYTGKLSVGASIPEVSAKTPDGSDLKLSDFQGKYLLLQFFTPTAAPSGKPPRLQAAFDAYGKDDRLVILGISVDASPMSLETFLKSHPVGWKLATLQGDMTVRAQITGNFGFPSIVLIGPDQKIIATDLQGDGIISALTTALGPPH